MRVVAIKLCFATSYDRYGVVKKFKPIFENGFLSSRAIYDVIRGKNRALEVEKYVFGNAKVSPKCARSP